MEREAQTGAPDASKINYAAVTASPVSAFYDTLMQKLPGVVDAYLSTFQDTLGIDGKQSEAQDQIAQSASALQQHYESDRIKTRRVRNGFITFAFFLLGLGCIWLRQYRDNKRAIAEYNAHAAQHAANTREANDQINLQSQAFMSTHTVDEAIACVARGLGIPAANRIVSTAMNLAVDPDTAIGIRSAFTFMYKSTPICDVVARFLEEKIVTTSASIVVTHREVDRDGNERIVRETLTAYHDEPTPYMVDERLLVVMTNLKPDGSFMTCDDKKKAKHLRKFENEQFAKVYRISDNGSPDDEQLAFEFFTIKAQEDYLAWARRLNGNIPQMIKENDTIRVIGDQVNAVERTIMQSANEGLGLHSYVAATAGGVSVRECLGWLRGKLIGYFEGLLRIMQMPLISPAINQEYWQDDGQYRIANYGEPYTVEDVGIVLGHFPIRIAKTSLLSFSPELQYQSSLEPWLYIGETEGLGEGLGRVDAELRSFRSENETEIVTVRDSRGYSHDIVVPYVRYYPISEPKTIFHVFNGEGKESGDVRFAIGPRMVNDAFAPLFADGQLDELAKEVTLWTNSPAALAAPERQELIRRIAAVTDDNTSLYRDGSGVYIVANGNYGTSDASIDPLKAIIREVADVNWEDQGEGAV